MQTLSQYPVAFLETEARSLLARLNQVRPFTMTMPMVKGASVSGEAFKQITELLESGKSNLRKKLQEFIDKIRAGNDHKLSPEEWQTAFSILRLRFNSILDQLDIFADVLSQRSEHYVGVWLAGLDVLAEDGLNMLKSLVDIPALVVYLDRGHGAAIRRARTRLPGGDENPVAVIQIPRERLIGSGIASSLIHEVGHQATALLDLVATLKKELTAKVNAGNSSNAWKYFDRWISEIVCDVWASGLLGIAATLGLMGVVTLPRYFQFRLDMNDPHPAPYARVWLSCAFGKKLFPDKQWDRLWNMWEDFYPLQGLKKEIVSDLQEIKKHTAAFVEIVLKHSTKEMKGKRLIDLFPVQNRQPFQLKKYYQSWKQKKINLNDMPPTLVFAIMGQAKADILVDAGTESAVLTRQLKRWAFFRN